MSHGGPRCRVRRGDGRKNLFSLIRIHLARALGLNDRIIYPNVQIVHSEGTCTGCKVAIMSSLFDMKNKGILDQAEGFTFTTGDVELPYGIPQEKVVSVGICVPKEKRGTRWSKGCPPNNVYTIEAVIGKEIKDSYSTE